jgi:hypothetical protein
MPREKRRRLLIAALSRTECCGRMPAVLRPSGTSAIPALTASLGSPRESLSPKSEIVPAVGVEIYAMRELKYQKMMKRAKIVPRPFVKLARRTATPPGLR